MRISTKLLAIGVIISLITTFFSSCRSTKYITQEIPVEVEKIKTEYKNTILYDSIYFRDSIYIESRQDTVFKTKFIEKYKLKVVTDTLVLNDTIQIPVTVTTTEIKEVEKPLKWYQKLLIYVGLVVLVVEGYKLYKKFKK
jgi:hypothetical protein